MIEWFKHNCLPYWVAYGYLHRTFIIPRNRLRNIFLHKFVGSDNSTMHDHPWWSISIILWGRYIEHTPEGRFIRKAGDITHREATDRHWIEIDKPVYTLFITGPKFRKWGFWCPNGWIHWKEYKKRTNGDRLSNGCGEI